MASLAAPGGPSGDVGGVGWEGLPGLDHSCLGRVSLGSHEPRGGNQDPKMLGLEQRECVRLNRATRCRLWLETPKDCWPPE